MSKIKTTIEMLKECYNKLNVSVQGYDLQDYKNGLYDYFVRYVKPDGIVTTFDDYVVQYYKEVMG